MNISHFLYKNILCRVIRLFKYLHRTSKIVVFCDVMEKLWIYPYSIVEHSKRILQEPIQMILGLINLRWSISLTFFKVLFLIYNTGLGNKSVSLLCFEAEWTLPWTLLLVEYIINSQPLKFGNSEKRNITWMSLKI